MNRDIHEMREAYGARELGDDGLPEDPLALFTSWFDDAIADDAIAEPNAMILSTATRDGQPRARTVLLKEWAGDEFVFYTNYGSAKSQEIGSNPKVSLTWLWLPHERQIRIEGDATRVSDERSDKYFACRPRLSQLGAWASEQSAEIATREALAARFEEVKLRFKDEEIPRPPDWGGIVVRPRRCEFWQGREGRMHDRIVYESEQDALTGSWRRVRLMP